MSIAKIILHVWKISVYMDSIGHLWSTNGLFYAMQNIVLHKMVWQYNSFYRYPITPRIHNSSLHMSLFPVVICHSCEERWQVGLFVVLWFCLLLDLSTQIAKFMGPTWGPPGSCRPQMGPMLAPWTLLSGNGYQFGRWSIRENSSMNRLENMGCNYAPMSSSLINSIVKGTRVFHWTAF